MFAVCSMIAALIRPPRAVRGVKVIALWPVVFLAVCCAFSFALQGAEATAPQLAREARKAQNAGLVVRAWMLYSEAARIDLNSAPKPLLAGLFTVLGASPDAANDYADRIVGWRTAATSEIEDQDKEVTAYRNAGLNYKPRQSPFTSVQELWLVLGLPKDLIAQALPFVTVFNEDAAVNIMEAAPQVVAALPGMTPDRLDAVLKRRSAVPPDVPAVLELLGPVQGATAKGGAATRLAVRVGLADGRQVAAETVILLLENADDPYRVLSWRDDFDG